MITSSNSRIFDLILGKLNENTQELENGNPVKYDGNFMFQFNQQLAGGTNFSIVSLSDTNLDFETKEIVPLVDVQSIQVPFVESNERDDWEKEFYVAIKIPTSRHPVTGETIIEFEESNPRYQAILETLDNMRSNLTFIEGDYKYTFKVKEPTKVNVFTYNGIYYQILSLTFNLTSLKSGFFGNETKLYLGLASDVAFGETEAYELDFVDFTEVVGKTTRAKSNIDDMEESYTIDKRIWDCNITINFNGNTADLLVYKEKTAQIDMNIIYQLKITNKNLNTLAGEDLDYTINVKLTTVNAVYQNNVVDKLTFKLERA